MPIGDDFQDNTPAPNPAPKKRLRYPPPSGTGSFILPAGQTLQQGLAAFLPAAVRGRTFSVDARVTLTLDIQEE